MSLRSAAVSVGLAAGAFLLLAGCVFEDRRPLPTSPPDAGGFDALHVGLRLAADPNFDGGCVWLESDQRRLSVIWPYGYSVRFGATVDLLDEDGSVVAQAGDELEIGGAILPDIAPARCRVSPDTVLAGEVRRAGSTPPPVVAPPRTTKPGS